MKSLNLNTLSRKKFNSVLYLFFALTFLSSSCAKKMILTGKASYYADHFNGRTTANGEKFQQTKLTAAHKSLPFGTVVKVTNLQNGKSVKVRINDRGPYAQGRIIDLSKKAATRIDMVQKGVLEVKVIYKNKRTKK
jgi:rare lipoprotein A